MPAAPTEVRSTWPPSASRRPPQLAAHAVEGTPDSAAELIERARMLRIDAEIDRLEALVAATDPSQEEYSRAFERLIALQREKRQG